MALYIDPQIRDRFESLSPELKMAIKQKDVQIYDMKDLLSVLEGFIQEKSK